MVPDEPLKTMVRERARLIAAQQLGTVEHTMRLENQAVEDRAARTRQLDALAAQVDARTLWDEP